ncbi:FAD-binding domain-containing protein [Xylariaceae sp. FL1272]|nr:FAD-binding domain-containing protein [Xylariaceae sp. FL1272]
MTTETRNSSIEAACRNARWPVAVTILYPEDDAAFTKATARWNAYGGPSYCAAVSPSTGDEVASIVKTANAANIPFLATGGRHNYGTTLKSLQGGLAIDLRLMNSVTVDGENSTARIGGGADIQTVLDAVSKAGFMIPSGSCASAGYIGVGIGAGVGLLQGTLGLVIDSLVSVDLVTASGDLIKVSQTSNPALFWALRGAGANFGIVTSAVFKVTRKVNNGEVYYADLIYRPDQKSAYFDLIESFNGNFPSQLGLATTMFWNADMKETNIVATIVWAGPEAEAINQLKPFFDINPIIAVSKTIPIEHLPKTVVLGIVQASCYTTNGTHCIRTLNVRQYSASAYSSVFDKFDAYLKQYPQSRTSALLFEMFSTHSSLAVPGSETAYPWRDATGNFMLQFRWTDTDPESEKTAHAVAEEIRADLLATSGYPDLSAYVSYAFGDETLEQKYGQDKLPRLLELKKQWDPDNRFAYCNPLVPLTSPST